jgi:hypothetical protein
MDCSQPEAVDSQETPIFNVKRHSIRILYIRSYVWDKKLGKAKKRNRDEVFCLLLFF